MKSTIENNSKRNQNIELVFILDTTSSMSSYIHEAKQNITKIYSEILKNDCVKSLKMGLINFRDHPPQDHTYITKLNNLTDDINQMQKYLNETSAHGGGDLPEAICCGLNDCLNNINWTKHNSNGDEERESNQDLIKIAILIVDAPPHGILCPGDGLPNGCPLNNDPIELAFKLAQNKITLYCIGCEPSITPYKDIYLIMSLITGGKYISLKNCDLLSNMIISGTNEEIKMEKLMFKIQEKLMKEAFEKGERINEDELTKQVHALLNTSLNDFSHNNNTDDNLTDKIIEMSKEKTLKDLLNYCKSNEISLVANNSGLKFSPMSKPILPAASYYPCKPIKLFSPTIKKTILKNTKKSMSKCCLKKKDIKIKVIRKSIRLMNKISKIISNEYGSILEINLRRSQRLLNMTPLNKNSNIEKVNIKRKNTNQETKSNKKVKFSNLKINKIIETEESENNKKEDFTNETITMSYSRRLAKKAIARNELN